jgi:ribosomal 50S subunit-recycling heat shock protein
MKKVVKKAAMGSKVGPKSKVKTVDRGMLPNVTVKSNPILDLKYKPSDKDLKIDTTSKKKMGGKVASKMMMKSKKK